MPFTLLLFTETGKEPPIPEVMMTILEIKNEDTTFFILDISRSN